MSPMERINTGMVSASAHQNRFDMSSSSGCECASHSENDPPAPYRTSGNRQARRFPRPRTSGSSNARRCAVAAPPCATGTRADRVADTRRGRRRTSLYSVHYRSGIRSPHVRDDVGHRAEPSSRTPGRRTRRWPLGIWDRRSRSIGRHELHGRRRHSEHVTVERREASFEKCDGASQSARPIPRRAPVRDWRRGRNSL